MQYTNEKNISKKFLSFVFTFCMLMYTISCTPINFSFATGVNSNKKIYVGGTLCIDETANPQVKNYDDSQFNVSYNENKNSYVISTNPGADIGDIFAEGNPNIIIKTHGSAVINSNNDFSVNGVNNLIIFDEDYSKDILNLKGGISFSGSFELYKNTTIGNSIENGKNVIIENGKLDLYAKHSAFKNISEKISVGSLSELNVFSESKGFDLVKKLVVKDGGKLTVSSKENTLGVPVYSSSTNWDNKFWENNSPTTNENVADISLSTELQRKNNYLYTFTDNSNLNGYYVWNLISLDDSMVRLSYDSDVFKGRIEIVSGIGQKLNTSDVTVFKLKANSNAVIRIVPVYGYSVNSDMLQELNLMPTANVNEYVLNVPNYNVQLNDLFVGQGNTVNLLSSTQTEPLKTTVDYNGEELNIMLEDPNKVLSDGAVLEVTHVKESTARYTQLLKDMDDDKSKFEHHAFFDIVIYKDTNRQETYSLLNDKVKVLFQIPKGWDKEELQAVLIHSIDDSATAKGTDVQFEEKVTTLDNVDYLSFETDHFSPYAFLDGLDLNELENMSEEDLNKLAQELEKAEESTQETDSNNTEADPSEDMSTFTTGDNTKAIVTCLIIMALVSVASFIILKRFEKKNQMID